MKRLGIAAFALVAVFNVRAEVTDPPLVPVADSTLVEVVPDNNLGGAEFFNAGTAGPGGKRNRGLLRFDLSMIPAGSKIISAVLKIEVTVEPQADANPGFFSLHRMNRSWGEGRIVPTGSPGLGLPAEIGDATWNSAFHGSFLLWTLPGATGDYVTNASYTQYLYGVAQSPYFFPLAPETAPLMTTDLQLWVDAPDQNFGWLLKTDAEEVRGTARRFGSRESAFPPELTVEFIRPPRLENVRLNGDQLQFSFRAEAGQIYRVEKRSAFAVDTSWMALTNLVSSLEDRVVEVGDSANDAQQFYRVVVD